MAGLAGFLATVPAGQAKAVDDLDAVVAHMLAHRAELIGEMQYEDTYRLAYIRGPEGIIVGLTEQLG